SAGRNGRAGTTGGTNTTGDAGTGAAGTTGGAGTSGDAGTTGGAGTGAAGAQPLDPLKGFVLAYAADTHGLGRSIYLAVLGDQFCSKPLTDPAIQAKEPAFAPDGKSLAFAALVSGTYQIQVLDLVKNELRTLTTLPGGASYPVYSPDGMKLAFV